MMVAERLPEYLTDKEHVIFARVRGRVFLMPAKRCDRPLMGSSVEYLLRSCEVASIRKIVKAHSARNLLRLNNAGFTTIFVAMPLRH